MNEKVKLDPIMILGIGIGIGGMISFLTPWAGILFGIGIALAPFINGEQLFEKPKNIELHIEKN